MYYYEKGKKVRNAQKNFQQQETYSDPNPLKENYESGNGGKCPTWVFIVLGVIAVMIASWLIWCIVNERKVNSSV